MQSPTFSVVIPCYNNAATIVDTIQSCLNQTVQPLEIIVVNDKSTDDTAEIIKANFEGNTIVKLFHQSENKGPSAARNRGWEEAKGDYVAFLDGDDIFAVDKIEVISKILCIQNQIDFLFHDYQLWNDSSLKSSTANIHAVPFVFYKLLKGNIVSTCTMVIRRNISIRFDESMRYCEDFDITLRLSYSHETYYLPQTLTFIKRAVLSKGGLSSNVWKMRQGEMKAYKKLAQLNFGFVFLIPGLLLWSYLKHLIKKVV